VVVTAGAVVGAAVATGAVVGLVVAVGAVGTGVAVGGWPAAAGGAAGWVVACAAGAVVDCAVGPVVDSGAGRVETGGVASAWVVPPGISATATNPPVKVRPTAATNARDGHIRAEEKGFTMGRIGMVAPRLSETT
jgi:hypothetical protein